MRFLLSVLWLAAACAGGGEGDDTDSGPADSGRFDANLPPLDSALPEASTCAEGEHSCANGCYPDQTNEPFAGCRLGCGRPCEVPEHGEAFCNEVGRCASRCDAPFQLVGGRCECAMVDCSTAGAECGRVDNGCGEPMDCGRCSVGAECTEDNVCQCEADRAEPNDTHTLAPDLASLGYYDSATYSDYRLSTADDVDWFEFEILDNEATFGSSPGVSVVLRSVPVSSDFDLVVYYVCRDGSTPSFTCLRGASTSGEAGTGCRSASSGADMIEIDLLNCPGTTDDSGTAFVRVSAQSWSGSCDTYELQVTVT